MGTWLQNSGENESYLCKSAWAFFGNEKNNSLLEETVTGGTLSST
jgi:hypothetical protein